MPPVSVAITSWWGILWYIDYEISDVFFFSSCKLNRSKYECTLFYPPIWDCNTELRSHNDIGFRSVDTLHAINIHFHQILAWCTKEMIWAYTFLIFWLHTPIPCCPLNNTAIESITEPTYFALWYKEVPKFVFDGWWHMLMSCACIR